ncbi:hypothetical protein CIB93_05395 [Streptomyces sp. WZ.A104]|uniref:VanZ family protein n=1 Tax=Streptomyces sp. WZ.A104 TaxID=2023771 RepID=UPI000BBCAB56|nr:VanZ family protein [Streptomyces sp. WZ.A104]PCG86977.1 hypothetical protein CIB93_05395 [Streptomyces sp. WZ.A104]
MFRTYLLPVEAAVTWFPLLAAVIMVPVAVHGYRRRGRAGGWPVLVLYSFVFYLLAALLQTVMPLPADTDAHCATIRYAETPQLEPFTFQTRISTAAAGDWSPAALATVRPAWTTLLNFMLLLPLGVYLRYYLRRGIVSTTALAFATSLFFETTQYTGLWFVYACPYRQFNVDDLTLNTTGALCGWLLAGPLTHLLPVNDPDRERTRYGTRVTLTRRALAFLADLTGWLITWTLTTGLLALTTDWPTGRHYALPAGAALGLLWFWLLPALLATTPGKHLLLLRLTRPAGGAPGPLRLTVRSFLLYSPLALAWLALAHHTTTLTLPPPIGPVLPLLAASAALVMWGSPPLARLLRRDRHAPHERWSGAVNLALPGRGDDVLKPAPHLSEKQPAPRVGTGSAPGD